MQGTNDLRHIDSANAPTRGWAPPLVPAGTFVVDAQGRDVTRTLPVALLAALGTALVIGIPTDVVPNPWFGREIGVRPSDVVVLIALSALTGALVATYTVAGASTSGRRHRLAATVRRLPPRTRHRSAHRGGRLRHEACDRFSFRIPRVDPPKTNLLGVARRLQGPGNGRAAD
jgi:hypothetical protein